MRDYCCMLSIILICDTVNIMAKLKLDHQTAGVRSPFTLRFRFAFPSPCATPATPAAFPPSPFRPLHNHPGNVGSIPWELYQTNELGICTVQTKLTVPCLFCQRGHSPGPAREAAYPDCVT